MQPTSTHGPRKRGWALAGLMSAVLVAVLAVAVIVTVYTNGRDSSEEFHLEPVGATVVPPFTPPVGNDQPNVTPPPNAGGAVTGNAAGLYGGTSQGPSCDPEQLINYLGSHPESAKAWSGVVGVSVADIPVYVRKLTPVYLRSDTYVTNHGYKGGDVTAISSVLQAGTAVFVDPYGKPVVKCNCGNPLTPPAKYEQAIFIGTPWASFSSTQVTIIQQTTVIVQKFVVYQSNTNVYVERPAGGYGPDQVVVNPPTPWPADDDEQATEPPTASPGQATTTEPGQAAPTGPGQATTTEPGQIAPTGPGQTTTTEPGQTAPASPGQTTTSPEQGQSRSHTASWVIHDCVIDQSLALRGTVTIKNHDPAKEHSYEVSYAFGPPANASGTTNLSVPAGQTGSTTVTATSSGGTLTPGPINCEITEVLDENGVEPTPGPALPIKPGAGAGPVTTTRPTPTRTSAPATSPATPSARPSKSPSPTETTESPSPTKTTESPSPSPSKTPTESPSPTDE